MISNWVRGYFWSGRAHSPQTNHDPIFSPRTLSVHQESFFKSPQTILMQKSLVMGANLLRQSKSEASNQIKAEAGLHLFPILHLLGQNLRQRKFWGVIRQAFSEATKKTTDNLGWEWSGGRVKRSHRMSHQIGRQTFWLTYFSQHLEITHNLGVFCWKWPWRQDLRKLNMKE